MWTSAKRTDSCREERPRACVLQPLGILLLFFWLIGAVLGNGPTDLALLASALERAAREVSAVSVPSLL